MSTTASLITPIKTRGVKFGLLAIVAEGNSREIVVVVDDQGER